MTWIGLAALFALCLAILHAVGLGRPFVGGPVVRLGGVASGSPEGAASAVLSLAEAVDVLTRAKQEAARARAAHRQRSTDPASYWARSRDVAPPPPPARFASTTECIATFLPELEVSGDELGFICSDTESWMIERRAFATIAHRRGEGAHNWRSLASYSLSAIASMRSACCVDPEPLLAVVPGLWCGILRDKLRAIGPDPEPSAIVDFESTMQCLSKRGVRLPERWSRISSEESRAAFRRFIDVARLRGAAPKADTPPSVSHAKGDASGTRIGAP